MIKRKYNLFQFLSVAVTYIFQNQSRCRILCGLPYCNAEAIPQSKNRSGTKSPRNVSILNFISSGVHFPNRYKIDWQRGIIFLSSTIFSILRYIFAEVQFDLCADSIYHRKCVLHFPDLNTNMLLEQYRFDLWCAWDAPTICDNFLLSICVEFLERIYIYIFLFQTKQF